MPFCILVCTCIVGKCTVHLQRCNHLQRVLEVSIEVAVDMVASQKTSSSFSFCENKQKCNQIFLINWQCMWAKHSMLTKEPLSVFLVVCISTGEVMVVVCLVLSANCWQLFLTVVGVNLSVHNTHCIKQSIINRTSVSIIHVPDSEIHRQHLDFSLHTFSVISHMALFKSCKYSPTWLPSVLSPSLWSALLAPQWQRKQSTLVMKSLVTRSFSSVSRIASKMQLRIAKHSFGNNSLRE